MRLLLTVMKCGKPGRFAINKYRQPGISKFMGVKVHAGTITRENRTALITAHRKGVAEKNLRLQKQHIANLPAALRPQIGVDNKGEVYRKIGIARYRATQLTTRPQPGRYCP